MYLAPTWHPRGESARATSHKPEVREKPDKETRPTGCWRTRKLRKLPLAPIFGFAQIHRSWAVNLRRVREIRPAPDGGWEVKPDPPVNRVLPVSRRRVSAFWERFGE